MLWRQARRTTAKIDQVCPSLLPVVRNFFRQSLYLIRQLRHIEQIWQAVVLHSGDVSRPTQVIFEKKMLRCWGSQLVPGLPHLLLHVWQIYFFFVFISTSKNSQPSTHKNKRAWQRQSHTNISITNFHWDKTKTNSFDTYSWNGLKERNWF